METQSFIKRRYVPINGDYYDKMEVAAIHNITCELVYLDEEGNEINVISRIEDLYTLDGVEYAVLGTETIRLDQIRRFNGEAIEESKRQNWEEEFKQRYYSIADNVLVGENDYYSLRINKLKNILELKAMQSWDSMDDIPDLKSQLISVVDYLHDQFGLLNDVSSLPVNEDGVLEAPFIPARGILMNAGLVKVADLLPLNCDTIVHNRGSFSVNSVRTRSFKDRYFAENWLSER